MDWRLHPCAAQDDPAHAAIGSLLAHANGHAKALRIIISQAATSNSQKICNLQTGIRVRFTSGSASWHAGFQIRMPSMQLLAGMQAACREHKWVLCLDDDVLLHPGSLADLVAAAEADPSAYMATGEAPPAL